MFNTNTDDRGQVGIGTLIVFIAMVLVAAIAAGVLINTAGFLQTQAEQTGEESSAQVSDRVQVISTTGNTSGSGVSPVIDVNITIQKAAGAGDIDINSSTIEYLGSSSQTLVHSSVDNTAPHFTTVAVGGTADSGQLTESDDRIEIQIDLNQDGLETLAEGESVDLIITTADGARTPVALRAPDIIDQPVVDL